MHELDRGFAGFEWINANDTYKSIYSFIRKGKNDKKNRLLFVLNFTPINREDYRVGVPEKKKYKLLLDSNEERFGGNGMVRETTYQAEEIPWDGQPYSVAYPLAQYGAAIFLF